MNRSLHTAESESSFDTQIDTLLGGNDDNSIVDAFFAMSSGVGPTGAEDVWEQALLGRLQARLAERMRHTIETSDADNAAVNDNPSKDGSRSDRSRKDGGQNDGSDEERSAA